MKRINYFVLLFVFGFLFSSCDNKNVNEIRSKKEEQVLLKNNPLLLDVLGNYLKESKKLETRSFNELDFSTGVIFELEDGKKVIVVSRGAKNFEKFNMFLYSENCNEIVLEDSEKMEKIVLTRSDCSQKCFNDFKAKLTSNHYLGSVYSYIGGVSSRYIYFKSMLS